MTALQTVGLYHANGLAAAESMGCYLQTVEVHSSPDSFDRFGIERELNISSHKWKEPNAE